MKNSICMILGLLFWTGVCGAAEDANTPDVILKTHMDAVFKVLQNKDLSPDQRDEQITKIVTPMFDFQIMAKLALGKKHLGKFNQEQFNRFTELFVQHLKNSYRDKLTLYTDEEVVYKKAIVGKSTMQIPTELIGSERKVEVLYKFRQKNKLWKIYDVEIEGVSIIKTYISQFDEVLKKGTVTDLLEDLAKSVEPQSTQS